MTINKNTRRILISILLVFFAVLRFPCDDIRLSMRLLFEIFAAIAIAMYVHKLNKWVAYFFLLATFSMIFPFYTVNSYRAFTAILFGVLLFTVITKLFTIRTIPYLYHALCIIALINFVYLIVQHYQLDPLFVGKDGLPHNLPVALMGNRNFSSALIAFCVPAFLYKFWKFFLPLPLISLFMSKSTGGGLAVYIGGVFYFSVILHWIIGITAIGFILSLILICNPIDITIYSRYKAGMYALSLFTQHWIFGSGIGHWKEIGHVSVPQLNHQWWQALHNEYIQTLFEMGIGAAIIITGYYMDIVYNVIRFKALLKKAVIPLTAIIIISVNSAVNFPFHVGTTALVAIIWMSILQIHIQTYKESKHEITYS